MKKFVIVIPSYKNEKWCVKSLQSALSQDYSNFRIIYTDDCSPDDTAKLVKKFIDENDTYGKIKFICNTERLGAMHNLYNMIHSCDDDEVVVTLDGDDWLAHPDVLKRVNKEYNSDVWMTWGSYVDWPANTPGCSRPIPENIINSNSFRNFRWSFSHLRTFKAGVFKKLPENDFKVNGNWMMSAWDLPIMFGVAELSGNRIRHISDTLYIYNNQNPISDFRTRLSEQQNFERIIRSRAPHKKIISS